MFKRVAQAGMVAGALAFGAALAQDSGGSGAPFRLSSAYVVDGQTVAPSMVGARCGGLNVSPQLSWSGLPQGTRSLALSVFDPDARQGEGFWHWLVYNIPASAGGLDAGAGNPAGSALPEGAVNGANGTGRPGYTGPCPPAGEAAHHYVFTLYALDVDRLDLPAGSSGAALGLAAEGHTLARTTLTVLYATPKAP